MKFGVFDSGIGGVTVLQALRKEFPEVHFVYFGDTLHVPYGTKSASQIRHLSTSAAERIRAHGVDALIVACNTASSLALPEIESALGSTPVYGMVEAGVRAVLKAAEESDCRAPPGPVVVFGTRATIRSGVYGKYFREAFSVESSDGRRREVFEQACPLLVPLIEEGWVQHPVLDATLQEYVARFRDGAPGIALLACTHYPWIRAAFERALPGWKVIDSADAVASRLREESSKLRIGSRGTEFSPASAPAEPVEWYFSDPEVAPFIFEGDESRPVIRVF